MNGSSYERATYREIDRACERLRRAATCMAGLRDPEQVLGFLCEVTDAEAKIREACAYLHGLEDGRAEAAE